MKVKENIADVVNKAGEVACYKVEWNENYSKDWGSDERLHSNSLPPLFREISIEEFAKSDFFTYGFKYIDHKQATRDYEDNDLPAMLAVQLFYMGDGTGYGISSDFWGGKITYYAFGCKHQYKEISAVEAKKLGIDHWGMFCHVYKCAECGAIHVTDSSG